MIQFANKETSPIVRQMWKSCFGDSDEFLDLFFDRVHAPEHTLIYFEGKQVAASLQMLPYTITYYGKEIPFYYLAGLCTLPHYRKRGYMAQLIKQAHLVMQERDIPLAILTPANDGLVAFYNKYGYQQVFEKGDAPTLSLKQLLDSTPNIGEAYKRFDALFRSQDFCVQKTFQDFATLVADARLDNYPPKTDLCGMAFVGNAAYLLSLYAKANPTQAFMLTLEGDRNYRIGEGECLPTNDRQAEIKLDRRMLCRLLFGYKTNELSPDLQSLFPPQTPVMNYMLE